MHLLTCQSVQGGMGEGQRCGVGGGREGGQGEEKGSTQGSVPGRCAQAQWPLPQVGAATRRSEPLCPGFARTVVPGAALVAA
jgi:hypothetical protein